MCCSCVPDPVLKGWTIYQASTGVKWWYIACPGHLGAQEGFTKVLRLEMKAKS